MAELSEEELSMRWFAVADQDSERWTNSLNAFSKNQPELWRRWAHMPQKVVTIGLQLACASSEVLAIRNQPSPSLDASSVSRSEKRLQTLLSFLLKRVQKGEGLDAAFNEAGNQFSFRQWALMGLIAETLLSEVDEESLSAEDAAHIFAELAIQIDGLDRALAKS